MNLSRMLFGSCLLFKSSRRVSSRTILASKVDCEWGKILFFLFKIFLCMHMHKLFFKYTYISFSFYVNSWITCSRKNISAFIIFQKLFNFLGRCLYGWHWSKTSSSIDTYSLFPNSCEVNFFKRFFISRILKHLVYFIQHYKRKQLG